MAWGGEGAGGDRLRRVYFREWNLHIEDKKQDIDNMNIRQRAAMFIFLVYVSVVY